MEMRLPRMARSSDFELQEVFAFEEDLAADDASRRDRQ